MSTSNDLVPDDEFDSEQSYSAAESQALLRTAVTEEEMAHRLLQSAKDYVALACQSTIQATSAGEHFLTQAIDEDTVRQDAADRKEWDNLREFVRNNLKAKERRLLEILIEARGRKAIKDIALPMEWENLPDNFNSARSRVNKKLERIGWQLLRHDSEALLESPSKKGRT